MKYVLNIVFGISMILLTAACANDKQKQEAKAENQTIGQFPTVPDQIMVDLWEKCDYIDIIFNDNPASMSQDDISSIRGSLNYISREPATRAASCRPVARVAYMADGTLLADTNVYCSEGCLYVEFIENGKVAYVNHLSRSGVEFYSDILNKLQPPQ